MKKRQALLFLIAFFFLISAVTSILYGIFARPFEKITIQVNGTISGGNTLGFNVATDALAFGHVPRHATGKRYLILTNGLSQPITVKIYDTGNISPYLTVNESIIRLPPQSEHNISILLTPTDSAAGYYEGFITAAYYRRFIS
jgi:hypothetical protein